MAYDKTIFMNSTVVAKIPKNKLEELRISILRNNMVDVRIYMFFPNETEAKPTKKGVWLSFANLADIIKTFGELEKNTEKDVCLEFEKSKADEQIRVYTAEFRNNKLVHIRTFFKMNDEFKPGRGVSFSITMLKEVTNAFIEAEKLKS